MHLLNASLDSCRFGISVLRGTIEAGIDPADVIEEIDRSTADLVIFRVPAGSTDIPTGLQCRGHVVIHADTLVYYAVDLLPGTAPAEEPKVKLASEIHSPRIAGIAERAFADYRAHYAANPLLPKDLVKAGYVEWALSRLRSTPGSNGATWVVFEDDVPAGFATCDVYGDSVEIVLNAVDPNFERRGLYGMLLRHIQHHYANQHLKKLVISTQIWNFTVQRQWARNGLRLFKAYDTYHFDRRLARAASNR